MCSHVVLGLSHVVEPNLPLGSELSCQALACGLGSPCRVDVGRTMSNRFSIFERVDSASSFICGIPLSPGFLLLSSVHFS